MLSPSDDAGRAATYRSDRTVPAPRRRLPAVGGDPAWVESWAYPARSARDFNAYGDIAMPSCYPCPDGGSYPFVLPIGT